MGPKTIHPSQRHQQHSWCDDSSEQPKVYWRGDASGHLNMRQCRRSEAPGRKLGEREFTEIGSKMHMGDLRGFFEVRNYSPEGASEAVMFHHNDATFALQAAFDLFFALGDALLLHFM